jgi:hypothetical protein
VIILRKNQKKIIVFFLMVLLLFSFQVSAQNRSAEDEAYVNLLKNSYRFYRQKTRWACPLDECRYLLMQLNIS